MHTWQRSYHPWKATAKLTTVRFPSHPLPLLLKGVGEEPTSSSPRNNSPSVTTLSNMVKERWQLSPRTHCIFSHNPSSSTYSIIWHPPGWLLGQVWILVESGLGPEQVNWVTGRSPLWQQYQCWKPSHCCATDLPLVSPPLPFLLLYICVLIEALLP